MFCLLMVLISEGVRVVSEGGLHVDSSDVSFSQSLNFFLNAHTKAGD